jgi:hypothetical protein
LAQVATAVTYTAGSFAVPGEQVFAFSATSNNNNDLDLTQLKELTNSPFGGVGAYPNGPDILTIVVRNANAGPAILSNLRLSWTEAQA